MNFLGATVASATSTEVTLRLSCGVSLAVPAPQRKLTQGENITLGVRPEDVVIDPDGEFAGQVQIVEHLGAWAFLHVRIGSGTKLVAVAPGDCQSKAGDRLRLGLLRQRVHLFDDSGKAIKPLSPRGAL